MLLMIHGFCFSWVSFQVRFQANARTVGYIVLSPESEQSKEPHAVILVIHTVLWVLWDNP